MQYDSWTTTYICGRYDDSFLLVVVDADTRFSGLAG
jgi:hypothetical protein